MTRLTNSNRNFSRQKIGTGELVQRIALGDLLLKERSRLNGRDWSRFLIKMGWEADYAQKCMRIARRFNSQSRREKLQAINLPFGIIEVLSSPQTPDELVDRFLSMMEHTIPSTENCRKILRSLYPKDVEIEQPLLVDSNGTTSYEIDLEPMTQSLSEDQRLEDGFISESATSTVDDQTVTGVISDEASLPDDLLSGFTLAQQATIQKLIEQQLVAYHKKILATLQIS